MVGNKLPDDTARWTALTDISRSFLVEAGAGSGKTSIIAGRVAYLFARGVEPKNIAAITFTEFAASELRIRIERFVNELVGGRIPSDIERAFPEGLSADQVANLEHANKSLDELTCTTIHGFAQALIKPYPAEAGIDPGAEIMDPAEGDLAFEERYQAWVKEHLSGQVDDDIIAELVTADETRGLAVIRSVADFLRRHRDAKPANHIWSSGGGKEFAVAVSAFEEEIGRFEFPEEQTSAACRAFVALAEALRGAAIASDRPKSRALIQVASITRNQACFKQDGGKRQLRTKSAWEGTAAKFGKSKAEGKMAFEVCLTRYDACHEVFATFLTMVAGELLQRVYGAMEGLLSDWSAYKRAAALLDFDDLLNTARRLVAEHKDVRDALAKRFRHVLVDEFQDTDPLQIDILWRLCGEAPKDGNLNPLNRVLRPGALFLVGDPKQAIYRFRGADVNAYLDARQAIGEEGLLEIVANFRSLEPILALVNDKFAHPLAREAGQPGFAALAAVRKPENGELAVGALDIVTGDDKPSADGLRDAEANRVAELCAHLAGNFRIRDGDTLRPCRFGDIALLAPVGTELWRFEEALEQRNIPVSTQAGKGFFRRQEIQDLIALTRAVSDARDTLALGALLRGPLVGLTESELLDIAEGIPAYADDPDRLPNLMLWTDLANINHELARRVIEFLQSLAGRTRLTTPYMLLSDAVDVLNLRSQLRQRFRSRADRALANVDLFLEMSRAYDVRGFRAFAKDMRANWEEQLRQVEGRPDAEEQSIALVTIHAAKGLEWPVVIPINMTGTPKPESGLTYDRRSHEFALPVLDIDPPGYDVIKSWNETELERERVRLWYVAATRSRDLLVLPRHAAALPDRSWARIVDLGLAVLPTIDPAGLGGEMPAPAAPAENPQTHAAFADEAKRISTTVTTIKWHRPSLHEADAPPNEPTFVFSDPGSIEAAIIPSEIAGSATRGTILHKLMEEVLTSEIRDVPEDLQRRAAELIYQLGLEPSADARLGIAPDELASTVDRTLHLAEVAAVRSRLVPEHTVFGCENDQSAVTLISGIADAIAFDSDGIMDTIVDWKSDVEITADKLANYRAQLGDYKKQTGARQALLVLMTHGRVIHA